MTRTRIILWTSSVVLLVIMAYYSHAFQHYGVKGVNSLLLTRDRGEALNIIQSWRTTATSKGNLFPFARLVTCFDFFFIPFFVFLIIAYSDNRAQKEGTLWLNTLLRLNMLLIVLAGFLDIIEDVVLFYNLDYGDHGYLHLWWISWTKFILVGWTLLVWVASRIKSIST
jgi:hypothetical protein